MIVSFLTNLMLLIPHAVPETIVKTTPPPITYELPPTVKQQYKNVVETPLEYAINDVADIKPSCTPVNETLRKLLIQVTTLNTIDM
jgi:hypothetical protein